MRLRGLPHCGLVALPPMEYMEQGSCSLHVVQRTELVDDVCVCVSLLLNRSMLRKQDNANKTRQHMNIAESQSA